MNQRLLNERRYHDAEAASRAVTFAHEPRRLRFADSDYIRHVPWISAAVQQLGHVAGRRVLDLGCGHGMAAVILARRGAMVSACDLSPGYVAEAQQRATPATVRPRAVEPRALRCTHRLGRRRSAAI